MPVTSTLAAVFALTVTFTFAFLLLPSVLAIVITALPCFLAVITPFLDTVAIFLFEVLYCNFFTEAFFGSTFALIALLLPAVSVTFFAAVTLFTGVPTITLQIAFFPFTFAVIVAFPVFLAVTTPMFVTVATFLLLLFHVTVPFTFLGLYFTDSFTLLCLLITQIFFDSVIFFNFVAACAVCP